MTTPLSSRIAPVGASFGYAQTVKLFGVNLTDRAAFFPTVDAARAVLQRLKALYRITAVRLHHTDWVIASDASMLAQLKNTLDACAAEGIAVVFCILSKHPGPYGDWNAYQRDLVAGVQSCRDDAAAKIAALFKAIGDHPVICTLSVGNEESDAPGYADYQAWATARVREAGYTGTLVFQNARPTAEVAAKVGAVEEHSYFEGARTGDEPTGYYRQADAGESWHVNDLGTPVTSTPHYLGEFGDPWPNPLRMENLMAFAVMARLKGLAGMLAYSYASNEGHYLPQTGIIERWPISTDPASSAALMACSLIFQDDSPVMVSRIDGNDVHHRTANCELNISGDFNGPARVCTFVGSLDGKPLETSERMLIVSAGDCQNTGYEEQVADGTLRQIVSKGTAPVVIGAGSPVPIPSTLADLDAVDLNPLTGETGGELIVERLDAATHLVRMRGLAGIVTKAGL